MTAHLTRDELVRWRDQAAGADRQRTLAHLAVCDICGQALSEVLDTAPVDEARPRPDRGGFAARGVALGPRAGGAWSARTPVLVLAASLAALALSAALIPGARRMFVGGETSTRGDTIRATRILLIGPVGDVRLPVEFAWRSPVQASLYRVDIADGDGRLLATWTAPGERSALPHGQGLQSNALYTWQVSALDEQGQPLVTSRRETFRIVGSSP